MTAALVVDVVCGMAAWDQLEQGWEGFVCETPDPAYEVLLTASAEPVPCCVTCAQGVRVSGDRQVQVRTRRSAGGVTWSLDAGELIDVDREPVGVWLRAHGLDPADVGYVEVDGPTVRAWLYEQDARGRRYLGADGKVATRVVTRHRHGQPPALQGRRVLRDRTDLPWPSR